MSRSVSVSSSASMKPTEGYMKKMTQLKMWSKKYFKLCGNELIYSEKPDSRESKTIHLNGYHIMEYPSRKFSFALMHSDGRTRYHLSCETQEEKVMWWSALYSCLNSPNNHLPVASPIRGDQMELLEGDHPKVGKEDYQKLSLLGTGGCGKVYKVQDNRTGAIYAMKVMRKAEVCRQNMSVPVMRESGILRKLDHPFVVKLHNAFQTRDKLYLVMDFHAGGTIEYHLRQSGFLPESICKFYGGEIALALKHLHSHGIMYRDLKLGNILMDVDGHAVLTDFGLATANLEAVSFCGTPHNMAPEIIQHQPYTTAVDWWSFGVIIYQLLFGTNPFTGPNHAVTYDNILHQPLQVHNSCSPGAAHLLSGCLQKKPSDRFNADGVQSSTFFNGTDWIKLESRQIKAPFKPGIVVGDNDTKFFKASTNPNDLKDDDDTPTDQIPAASTFEGYSFYERQTSPNH